MEDRGARVARGGIAGAFATTVAAVGHGLADGAAPSTVALLLGLVFATVLGTFAIGRRPSLPRLAVVVGGSQLAFHLLFSALTPGTAVVGHHGSATILATGAHHATGAGMWLAHLLALVATVWFLRRAELALWNLVRAAVEAVSGLRLPAIASRTAPGSTSPGGRSRHPLVLLLFGVVSRRGPPRPLAAV